MANNFAGLRRVGYSDTKGGTPTWITGKVSAESSIDPENTTSESTDGILYGGGQISGEIMFFDHADYSTLEGFMTSNEEKFWHFEYKDGRTLVTDEAINPFVRRGGGVNARDGLVAFVMSFEKYASSPII